MSTHRHLFRFNRLDIWLILLLVVGGWSLVPKAQRPEADNLKPQVLRNVSVPDAVGQAVFEEDLFSPTQFAFRAPMASPFFEPLPMGDAWMRDVDWLPTISFEQTYTTFVSNSLPALLD